MSCLFAELISNELQILHARRSHSVLIHVLCQTPAAVDAFWQLLVSGRLRESIERLWTCLWGDENEEIDNGVRLAVALRCDNEQFQRANEFFDSRQSEADESCFVS